MSYDEFLQRHVCRVRPKPQDLLDAERGSNPEVYRTMWGPDELRCTGSLRSWDRSAELLELVGPYLVTSGRHDEVAPAVAGRLAHGLRARHAVFKDSSHNPQLEEPDRYLANVRNFLVPRAEPNSASFTRGLRAAKYPR